MTKRVKRVLDLLRVKASDARREKTSAGGGPPEPQRLRGHGRS
jgi:hypothetical protein